MLGITLHNLLSDNGERIMLPRMSCIAVTALALNSLANADIIYSDLTESASTGENVSFEIAGLTYEFGILTGGPLDYAYISTSSEGAGLFVTATDVFNARNFSAGESIGTLTAVLDMYPLGGGSENINLSMYDFVTDTGNWNLGETGYVGFGFGSGTDFNYGWIEFTINEGEMSMTGFAYNDVVNESITVGQIPAPAALSLLAIAGIASRRRRRG